MKLFKKGRSPDEVWAELHQLNHNAKRMTVKHPEYGGVHDQMNELLDELEAE